MEIYTLDSDILNIGANTIIITKTYNYNTPVFYLINNNKKNKISNINKISNKQYEVNFNIYKKSNYKIHIIDNNIEEYKLLSFSYENNLIKNINLDNLKLKSSYYKDKIFLNFKKELPINKDFYLNFEGDINKSIMWKSDLKEIEISFPYKIKGFTTISFKINGILKKIKVYNIDDFPKNLIKIKGGLKLNRICDFDLRLISDASEWVIKKGESMVYLDMIQHENFKVYIDDYLLFEQKIIYHNFLPKLTILNEPLRIKISQSFHEDVSIKFKNKKEIWIIPQGKTETFLTYDKGLRLLEIENVKNAICENSSWVHIIK